MKNSVSNYVCQRNVLLIIADDLGVDQVQKYVNYYGTTSGTGDNIIVDHGSGGPPQMRIIDKLANAGVTFVNAWASPVCSPSRACLFTGTPSFNHRVYLTSPTGAALPSGMTTIANVLKDSGYATGLFGKWHLGNTPEYRPLEFGWQRFAGSLDGEVASYFVWEKADYHLAPGPGGVELPMGSVSTERSYATFHNINVAFDWISSRTVPWMATVAFNAPHWSGSPALQTNQMPPDGCAYVVRTNDGGTANFRSTIECMDHSIGDLLTLIGDSILENTTVIFMGDNGTEESRSEHFAALFPGGGHSKGSLHEGGINVPLIIADGWSIVHPYEESPSSKGKGRVDTPGRFETNLVQTLDLFATIAEIGRGDLSTGWDSVSLLPYLDSASAARQREFIFAEDREEDPMTHLTKWQVCCDTGWDVAVRDATYKLIVWDYGSTSEDYDLYDLSNDRWETTDLWDPTSSAIVAIRDTFRAAIDAHLGSDACALK